jgi:hypothetical protein
MKRKRKQKESKLDKYLLLSWRKLWILVVAGFISIIIHNLFYAIFGFEEAVFFIIVVFILPLYFLAVFIYTLIQKIKDRSLFEKYFLIKAIISIILAFIVSTLIIEFSIMNAPAIYILTVVFSFLIYYLIKFFTNKRR